MRAYCRVTYGKDAYDSAAGADALVVITEWEQFRGLDLSMLRSVMTQPVLVDFRRTYRPEDAARLGFAYYAVGWKPPKDLAMASATAKDPSLVHT
jgi:UDPglucose 6-dehydrogenase